MHDAVDGLDRLLERQPDRRLSREIENQGRPNVVEHRDHAAEVAKPRRMERHAIVDAQPPQSGVARNLLVARCSMNVEAAANQEFGQIGSILAGCSQNECAAAPGFHDGSVISPAPREIFRCRGWTGLSRRRSETRSPDRYCCAERPPAPAMSLQR